LLIVNFLFFLAILDRVKTSPDSSLVHQDNLLQVEEEEAEMLRREGIHQQGEN
jgi:hypothetical protein